MEWINKILALPFQQKLLGVAVLCYAIGAGLRWGPLPEIPTDVQFVFIGVGTIALLSAVYSWNQDKKRAIQAEAQRLAADSEVRVARMEAGMDPEKDRAVYKPPE
tara:strand:+ start:673 stop:987 length:315 start_codon:yes stop_codon:yes gene_type:complete